MALTGKGIYIWQLHRIAGGNVSAMVDKARDANLTHVIIKIADGNHLYNANLIEPAANAFRAAGVQVWGWAWLWMRDALQEAETAAGRVQALELDGFVINAEDPVKGKIQDAQTYMSALRNRLPDLPIGLSSYRYPQLHRSLPWEAFLTRCNLNLPQMYWVGESPAECLQNSIIQHQAFPFAKPIIPTGASYGEQYGGTYFRAQPAQIVEFLDAVRANHLPAANFWSWDWTEAHGPDLWQAIANYNWPTTPDVAQQFWQALTAGDLDAVAALYHHNAVYITATQTVQGPTHIRAAFAQLLHALPDAEFHQDQLRQENNLRFLHWSATSTAGQIRNGVDSIGIRAGKIQYHSSSYDVTE